MKTRQISDRFLNDLKDDKGELNWIYKKVKTPQSKFSLEIREGYINIYYRGGSLLKIQEKKKDSQFYSFKFDKKYGERKDKNSDKNRCEFMIQHQDEVKNLTNDKAKKYFDEFIKMMDGWFEAHHKKEREYQHYASLPYNNDNVIDIEYAIGESGMRMRLDMVMIDESGELYLIENKYGNYALSSQTSKKKLKDGLEKHYGDMIKAVTDIDHWSSIKESMESILKEKIDLGLIPSKYKIKLDGNGKPIFHILFVLANLTLSNRSQIIVREQEIIRKKWGEYIDNYPPKVLCVGKEEYKINLHNAENLLDFRL